MTERIRSILDIVSARVLAYRPTGDEPKLAPKEVRRCASCGAKVGYSCSPDCLEPR